MMYKLESGHSDQFFPPYNAAQVLNWGSSESRPRGEMLLDAISRLDVLLLNTGSRPTFVGSQGGFVIDLTFASDPISERVKSSRVSDAYTGSDHRAIVFEVLPVGNRRSNPAPASRRKWSACTMDRDRFGEMMSRFVQFALNESRKSLCPHSRKPATPPC
ncbi:unnamed protein product [Trichogramma brassicae]|uniref:Endonuclease/exonuclease/phosphatase domain-containing protein n=1 Tax=Trichogramma brassicae TaxID=86971 RepID=A0A6H5INW8_9HYME|nr:unnamed protein product [Trichogramma brassicae]